MVAVQVTPATEIADLGLFWTVPDAARTAEVSIHAIDRAIATGALTVYRFGLCRWRFIDWDELARWMRAEHAATVAAPKTSEVAK